MITTEKITKMLNTRQLSLTFWQRLDYFRSVYVCLIISVMLLLPIIAFDISIGWGYYLFITSFIPASYFLYLRLKKGLKFKEIKTNLSQNENYIKIRNTFEAMNVEVDYAGMNWLVGRVNKLLPYSGEQLCIINTDGSIYINSISPKRGLRFKVNRQNVEIFEQYFYLNE